MAIKRQKYTNHASAMAASKAKLGAFNRGEGVGNITVPLHSTLL